MRVNFATGVIVGVLLASLAVVASSGYSGPSSAGPLAPTRQTVGFTAISTTSTTTAATTTSSATVANGVVIPAPTSNFTSSVSTITALSSTTSQFAAALSSSSSGRPPSSLAVIAREPLWSLLLLLPIALAIVLGVAIRKITTSAD